MLVFVLCRGKREVRGEAKLPNCAIPAYINLNTVTSLTLNGEHGRFEGDSESISTLFTDMQTQL